MSRPSRGLRRASHFGQTDQRQGFLLVAVLIGLLIAGLMLTTLAGRSFSLATEAVTRHEALQYKWGAISCQRTLLPAAGTIFEAVDAAAPNSTTISPPPSVPLTVVLGGVPFELLLSDEDTKLNLNMVYHFQGRAGLQRLAVRHVGAGQVLMPLRIMPSTGVVDPVEALDSDEDQPLPPAFSSWGQVFDLQRAVSLEARWSLPRLTSKISCWGPGRLNVARASDETVADVCRSVLSQGAARKISRDYREDPRIGLKRLIERSGANAQEQRLLAELLAEQSACYSLWISAGRARTRFQQFVVAERDEEGVLRTREFLF